MNVFFQRVMLALTTVVAAGLTLLVLYFVETRFASIIADWRVTSIRYENGAVYVSGEMTKKRPCKLVQTDVKLLYNDGTAMLVHQLRPHSDVLGVDVTTGHTTWGPIKINTPTNLLQEVRSGDKFVVTAMHQCHGLWLQTSEYGAIGVDRVLAVIRGGT